MVTRIATAAANQGLVTRMLEQQARVNNDQTQLSTGFKSQDYLGISGDSFQLSALDLGGRGHLQRCYQPLPVQIPGVGRNLPDAEAGRAPLPGRCCSP